jgi:hypothetical protein
LQKAQNNNKTEIELHINNQAVTGDIQQIVRKKASIPQYEIHLTNKYGWKKGCYGLIDWKAIEYATNNQSNRKFVTKLIHGWLPTRGHPAYKSETTFTKTCPYCNNPHETNQHFCLCQTDRKEKIIQLTTKTLGNNKTEIHKTLCNTIAQHLRGEIPSLPNRYYHIEKEQHMIGWEQITMGRLSAEWGKQYEIESSDTVGYKHIGKIIKHIWKYHQDRWYERCEKVNNENETTFKENEEIINVAIQERYEQYNNLERIDKDLLSIPIKTRLEMKHGTKRSWLQQTEKIFKIGVKRSSEITRQLNRTILEYFKPTTVRRERNTTQNRRPKLVINENDETVLRTHKENYRPP